MARAFHDNKIMTQQDEKVREAVKALSEALLATNGVPEKAVIQEIIISHPGNADSMIHLRTVTNGM